MWYPPRDSNPDWTVSDTVASTSFWARRARVVESGDSNHRQLLVEPIEELAAGIEPASPEYETGVLPLNYASMHEPATEQVYPPRSLGPRPTVFLASVTSVRSGSRSMSTP